MQLMFGPVAENIFNSTSVLGGYFGYSFEILRENGRSDYQIEYRIGPIVHRPTSNGFGVIHHNPKGKKNGGCFTTAAVSGETNST
jgi:hypothetical protein